MLKFLTTPLFCNNGLVSSPFQIKKFPSEVCKYNIGFENQHFEFLALVGLLTSYVEKKVEIVNICSAGSV